jgi:SET domain-containing protein
MTKQKIIQNILHNTKLCLKPSRVCTGVGLFTILPIKKGDVLMQDVSADTMFIRWDELSGLHEHVKTYLNTLCNSTTDGIFLSRTPNNINLAYFVNHSDSPNITHDLTLDEFVALRDIEVDEEIVCAYTQEEMW